MEKSFAQTGLDRTLPHIGVIMEKTDTDLYPRYELPPGYTLSKYRPGFEQLWIKQQVEVGEFDETDEAESVFKLEFLYGEPIDWVNFKYVRLDPQEIESAPFYRLMSERILFILDSNGGLAATGSLWHGNHFGETYQRLHWISVSPTHQNKGLGKVIVSKLLDLYNKLGYSGYVYLTSQTWSYKALNIYAGFGFGPYMGEMPKNYVTGDIAGGKNDPWDYKTKNTEAWELINSKIKKYRR